MGYSKLAVLIHISFWHYWIKHSSLTSPTWLFLSKRAKKPLQLGGAKDCLVKDVKSGPISLKPRENAVYFTACSFQHGVIILIISMIQKTEQCNCQRIYLIFYTLLWQVLIRSELLIKQIEIIPRSYQQSVTEYQNVAGKGIPVLLKL